MIIGLSRRGVHSLCWPGMQLAQPACWLACMQALTVGPCRGGPVRLTKARVEAEDAQRMLLGALNGLAALLLADRQPGEAIALYRQACSCSPDALPCCHSCDLLTA